MATTDRPSGVSLAEARRGAEPRYVRGGPNEELTACFPNGAVVPVSRGRARGYPGLAGAAPPTDAFYAVLPEVCPDARIVLDVGSGSAKGTRVLCERFGEVFGLETDPNGVAFAREYAPAADYVLTDLRDPPLVPVADGAIVTDVLAHTASPDAVMRSVRARLADGARILIAELAAFGLQSLAAPVRRAYSRGHLAALLARTGFRGESWLTGASTFVAGVAVAVENDGWSALGAAERHIENGDADAVLAAYAEAARSARREVQLEAAIAEGNVRLQLGDGDGAVSAFLRAREVSPEDARAPAALSRVATALGQRGEAIELASAATRIDPTSYDAACAVALIVDQVAPHESLDSWRRVLRLAPDDSEVALRLAEKAAEQGSAQYGIEVLERVRAYGDALPARFHVVLASLLHATGRAEDAQLEARLAGYAAQRGR